MKFLFISKEYPPFPDASGSIVYHLADCLKKQGHKVDVIARDYTEHIDKGENGDVCWIRMSSWEKLSKRIRNGNSNFIHRLLHKCFTIIRKIVLMLFIKHFPDSEWWITKRTVKAYEKYLHGKEYDCVMGFFRPYSCLSATILIAEQEKSSVSIACYFDIVDMQQCPSMMPKKLYEKLVLKGDHRIIENSDCIMLPVSAQKKENMILNAAPVVVYYEFPTFVPSEPCGDTDLKKTGTDIIKLVFAGTMDISYRNPQKMLEILSEVTHRNSQIKLQLDIFGGGNCEELIRSFGEQERLRITYHGQVSKNDVIKFQKNADVLINIMNSFEGIVPSKIFELFAYGKPILNFETSGDDGSMIYFEKYPMCKTLRWENTDEVVRDEIVETAIKFLLKSQGQHIEIDSIKKLYVCCTPEYVADQIIQEVERGKKNGSTNSENSIG